MLGYKDLGQNWDWVYIIDIAIQLRALAERLPSPIDSYSAVKVDIRVGLCINLLNNQ